MGPWYSGVLCDSEGGMGKNAGDEDLPRTRRNTRSNKQPDDARAQKERDAARQRRVNDAAERQELRRAAAIGSGPDLRG